MSRSAGDIHADALIYTNAFTEQAIKIACLSGRLADL
jgi:hypothetical protein